MKYQVIEKISKIALEENLSFFTAVIFFLRARKIVRNLSIKKMGK